MKHACVGIAVVMIGCGGGDGGEPIGGTIAFRLGGETITPTAGAALQLEQTPPNVMLILIATSTARCGITGMEDPPDYVLQTQVDNTTPATHNDAALSLLHIAGENDSFSSFGTGTVVIDLIGTERITGSITYADPDSTPTVDVTGTFDVIRCF